MTTTTPTEPPTRIPNLQDHALIGSAANIPINAAVPTLTINPIILSAPNRITDLHLKLTLPATGPNLPIILLSHGHGASNNLSSLNGYGPLGNFWAAHGFAVIQPTHLSSKTLNLGSEKNTSEPLFWRSRIEDMKTILDRLDEIESSFPALLQGRLDHTRIAVAGHSLGGHTAGMLLGGKLLDPIDKSPVEMSDSRIKAGILLAAPGNGDGGESVTPMVNERFGFFTDYSLRDMATPTLVVVGDNDASGHLTTRGAAWHMDGYYTSQGPKALLTLVGGKHGLGGVSGYDTAEAADDESPERLAVVQRLSWAYLRTVFDIQDEAWNEACRALEGLPALGKVEVK
ncbi:platelet-activating factor acetylhydrolase plasma/intracellular [Aspergillus heteromorphus CBS 117.55]|uniref:Platelet-activating factor acetylhydrolase plasma/intracellular n=1 Tax=Aspergillus heteromorphus CBS 117.55 TaxID=1448321 RepID=A0A317WCI3_9EURO|nr:platelet-activating factor acetylhydrolase plasma/intracellular [Aspergillus heteromorphus CBS 117.55]PWY81860.1 platelet-activating factor acetylhydrolase plasma/intracellular [Aspergillus heteromorphus CBS 117.55]